MCGDRGFIISVEENLTGGLDVHLPTQVNDKTLWNLLNSMWYKILAYETILRVMNKRNDVD